MKQNDNNSNNAFRKNETLHFKNITDTMKLTGINW